jgi:DNA repair protein RadA/Sms
VRDCAACLVRMAKATGIAVVIIGHVTKSGDLAGPRTVEHMVSATITASTAIVTAGIS